ncbi:unnamed protein product, partial [Urochloa humidicola]
VTPVPFPACFLSSSHPDLRVWRAAAIHLSFPFPSSTSATICSSVGSWDGAAQGRHWVPAEVRGAAGSPSHRCKVEFCLSPIPIGWECGAAVWIWIERGANGSELLLHVRWAAAELQLPLDRRRRAAAVLLLAGPRRWAMVELVCDQTDAGCVGLRRRSSSLDRLPSPSLVASALISSAHVLLPHRRS